MPKAGLVLTQIRDNRSGRLMEYGERCEFADRYCVPIVQRLPTLEGMSAGAATGRVRNWPQQVEGAVLRLVSGVLVKAKTSWWLKAPPLHRYGWLDDAQRQAAAIRHTKKVLHMELLECRAVCKGLPRDVPPAILFRFIAGVQKVEAFFNRATGRRSAIVLSFKDKHDRDAAITAGRNGLTVTQAYSSDSSSNGWHFIRTWRSF